MKIELTELFAVPGRSEHFEVSFDEKNILNFRVRKCEPTDLLIRHEKDRNILISGKVRMSLEGRCDRCLKPVPVEIEKEIDRMADAESGRDEEGEPAVFLDHDELDASRLILETVMEDLPMKVLCREDCKGLCPRCGADLNDGPCGCEKETQITGFGEAILKAFQNADKE